MIGVHPRDPAVRGPRRRAPRTAPVSMTIGRSRLSVGPLRDLGQLHELIDLIGRIPGVAGVTVDAFDDRRARLGLQVLRPVDLGAELRRALGSELVSCAPRADRLEVQLRGPAGPVDPGRAAAGSSDVEVPEEAGPFDGRGPFDDVDAPGRTRASGPATPGAPRWVDDDSPWADRTPDRGTVRAPHLGTGVGASAATAVLRPGPSEVLALGPGTSGTGSVAPEVAGADELAQLSFAHAPIAQALVSPDGRWLRVNRRLCELVGRDEEELLRGGLGVAGPAAGADGPDGLVAGALGQERDRLVVHRDLRHADGHAVPVRVEVSLVRSADGRPRLLILQLVDR